MRAAVAPLLQTAKATNARALIVACFSDPGLEELRRASDVPVYGIAESAIKRAEQLGSKVGVVSSVADSVPRHDRYWARLGVSDLIVGDIPMGLGVLELGTPRALDLVIETGNRLKDLGADVLVLGCAGMTHMQPAVEAAIGIPVVDPCEAAVQRATAHDAGEMERER